MSVMTAGGGPGPDRARSRLRRLAARLGPDLALLRRSREFRLLYAGQTLSLAGSMITFVAMPYQAYRLTGSSLVVGLLSVTEVVPLVASALLGGALADAITGDGSSVPPRLPWPCRPPSW